MEQNNKPPLDNIIERSLREVPEQNNLDANALLIMSLMEQQKAKTEIAKLFVSDKKYKTEISNMQRQLVPILMQMGSKPFESTERVFRQLGKSDKEIKTVLDSQKMPFVLNYLPNWLELGIAVGREGRKEDKEVISALVSSEMEMRLQNANNQKQL